MATTNADTTHFRDKQKESADDMTTDLILTNGRCCFCFPFLVPSSDRSTAAVGSASVWWERMWKVGMEGRVWTAAMRAREWTEVVAGPRWKTFVLRFLRKKGRLGKFQYDPLSYALNFDDGHGQNGNLDSCCFTARYGAPLVSAKSGVEIGTEDLKPAAHVVPTLP